MYWKEFGKLTTAAVLIYCKHELMHVIWSQLLDKEFIEAYVYEMQVECINGIICQFFLWIFIYSVDYPKK
jgi:hypothetical protein